MRILMISSYPPTPCGIGAYAAQQVAALRNEGHVVDVFAHPATGPDGDFVGDLHGGWRILKLARYLWAYEGAIIQFTPNFFFRADSSISRLFTSLGFLILCLFFGRRLEIIFHETEFRITDEATERGMRGLLDRWAWRMCRRLVFHSVRERDAFARHYRFNPGSPRFQVVEHDRYFHPHATGERGEIRRTLGLPEESIMFLCIGFVQPHKGFDRLLRTMRRVESDRIIARIVGSVRINWQPALDYARKLHEMAADDPRAEFVENFITDEEFDRWVIASDYVVVPYHEIWSSSIAARAKLLGRHVIASTAGALAEQLPEGSIAFGTDKELESAIRRIAEGRPLNSKVIQNGS